MDEWMEQMLINEIGEEDYEILCQMLEKNKQKPSSAKIDIEHIIEKKFGGN